MNSKSENIKNYYIKKRIQENTLKYKNTAKEIRLNKENTLENQIWENQPEPSKLVFAALTPKALNLAQIMPSA